MAFAELDGVRIHFEVAGEAGLPALVLSNSLGVNLSMWEPQVSALASHFRLVRYDTRGHGQSSIPPGPYTIAELGRDVLGLLDLLEIGQASFCGISMGGVIGQAASRPRPQSRSHRRRARATPEAESLRAARISLIGSASGEQLWPHWMVGPQHCFAAGLV